MAFDREYFDKKVNDLKLKSKIKAHQRLLIAFSKKTHLSDNDEREITKLLNTEKAIEKAERQIKKAEEIAKKYNAKERKDRNRKVFLYGLLVEQSIKDGTRTEEQIIEQLDKILTRKSDREFLGLPPLN